MTLEEIRAALAACLTGQQTLANTVTARFADPNSTVEVRTTADEPHFGYTEDEHTQAVALETEEQTLRGQLQVAERAAALANDPAHRTPAVPEVPNANVRSGDNPHDIDAMRSRGSISEARAQARAAVEAIHAPDVVAEGLTRYIATASPAEVAQIAASTDPKYRSAFFKRMSDAEWAITDDERAAVHAVNSAVAGHRSDMFAGEFRAASLTIGSSGWSLPVTVDDTFINTGDLELNPIGQLATNYQSTTNRYTVNQMGGATHEWVAEGAEVADGTPTSAPVHSDCHLGDVYVQWSYLADQDVTMLEENLRVRIGEAMSNGLAAAFETGTGTGMPRGIVTALLAVAAGAGKFETAATSIVEADCYGLMDALQQRHRRRARFLFGQNTANYLRSNVHTGTGGERLWSRDLANGTDDRFMGKPVTEPSVMDEAAADMTFSADDAPVVYGDIAAAYAVVRRVGMYAVPNPVVTGSNGRPTGEQGLVVFHRTGGDVQNPNAAKVLEIS